MGVFMSPRLLFAVMVCVAFVLAIFAVPRPCEAEAGARACIPGTYLIKQEDGTQSLWSLSRDGGVHITSSAEAELQFSHEQGIWQQTGPRTARITTLDFSFRRPPDDGVSPLSIARVDAQLTFFEACRRVEGNFELRFFDPQSEDALDPLTDTGDPLGGAFTGRRLTIDHHVS
jgi:hypothetical protein